MERRRHLEKIGVACFFALLLLVGVFTLRDYAAGYDELVQQGILRSNAKEYALSLQKIGLELPTWLAVQDTPISQSVERDHGIAPMYLCLPFLRWMNSSLSAASTLWSAAVWFWFMTGLWSLYAIARRLGLSRPLACLSTLLLFLSPRFFAHAHLNDKDLVLLCLVLDCLWLGMRFLDKLCWQRALPFSLAGALAANLRITGAMPWGLICLGAVVLLCVQQKWSLRKAGLAVCTFLSFLLFYLLLTPAAWREPMAYLRYLISNSASFSRWSGVLFFRGAEFHVPDNSLPFYYLPYLMIVTLPLYTLPVALIGGVGAVCEYRKQPRHSLGRPEMLLLLAAFLCALIPLALYMVMRPIVYNGWRHFYFACAGVLILGAYGIGILWKLCHARPILRRIFVGALCLCFGVTAVGMAINHPYEASYYNLLCSKGTMETDYWNTGGAEALKRLGDCDERNPSLPMEVGCYFFDLQNARFKLNDDLKAVLTTTTERDAPYLYYIENYVQVYNVPEPEGYHALFHVYSYGRLIGTMYEINTDT